MTIYFKRGISSEFIRFGQEVHCFGQVLLNLDTWELFIADGKTPTSQLTAVGLLPETMRDKYRGLPE